MALSAFLLGATQSNSGKTTLSMALMAALRKKGRVVQPYKVGPDYIDPMYHREATGRWSRNLDSFMLPAPTIRYLFHKNCRVADVAVVEGVMGLFDGKSGFSKEGSSAHIAEILNLPVILIVNGNGMSLSAAALVNGFKDFSKTTKIGGVILNQVKTESGYRFLKEIIESQCHLPVFGYLPKDPAFALNDRHLGLYCSGEVENLREKLDLLADAVLAHIDLDGLLSACRFEIRRVAPPSVPRPLDGKVRIGVARDAAFNFYYQDSLELLGELGAEIVPFSPLKDDALPDVDGLYLGGGYPELNLDALSDNVSFRADLKKALENGMVCYAECGGFIYLGRSMTYEGHRRELTGFFPFDFAMTDRLQRFGYMEAAIRPGTPFTPEKGLSIRGHEFHYTKRVDSEEYPHVYDVTKERRTAKVTWEEGYVKNNTVGGYPHFHFYANPAAARNFLLSVKKQKEGR